MRQQMNRLLLALLALLAGLFTQVSPVQARLCGARDTEIGAVEAARGAVRSAPCQSVMIVAPVARQEYRETAISHVRPAYPSAIIPSVLFGADRAYE
jgi:hypothetical protein